MIPVGKAGIMVDARLHFLGYYLRHSHRGLGRSTVTKRLVATAETVDDE